MSSPAQQVAGRLSALRLVSFVPPERDAVRVGLLSPDAEQVVDLVHLGIGDALEAIDQLETLRRAAGAIMHNTSRTAFAVSAVHLVAPIPLTRCVVLVDPPTSPEDITPTFVEPTTLHGPGGHMSRVEAAGARVGIAAVVGDVLRSTAECSDETLDRALVGSVLVLGWPEARLEGQPMLRPRAVGPFVAVPRRRPESLHQTRVAPLETSSGPDESATVPAPDDAQFFALARAALRTHTLHPGDLLTIFPGPTAAAAPHLIAGGSWVRVSAPGLGTLSLAVR